MCALFFPTISQNIDSLKTLYYKTTNDSIKCDLLAKIIDLEPSEKIWPKYNDTLLVLCEKKLKNKDLTKTLTLYFKRRMATAISNMGFLFVEQGNLSAAEKLFLEAIVIQKAINDKKGEANSYNNIAQTYQFQANLTKAFEFTFKALKMSEELRDSSIMAICLNNLAVMYEGQGDFNKAVEYLNLTLRIYEKENDERQLSNTLNNLGFLFKKQKKYKEAIELYERSLALSQKIGHNVGTSNALNNLGRTYDDAGDINKALDYITRSLKMEEEMGNKPGIALTLNNLGAIYLKKNELDKALMYSTKSLNLSKEIGSANNILHAADILKDIYLKKKDHAMAFKMYELEILMRDSISNINTRKTAIRSQLKHEFERKAIADSLKTMEEKRLSSLIIEGQSAQIESERTLRFALFGGLFLVMVFAAFVYNRFKLTQKQKLIIETQKTVVEEKQKEILDSINYAKRIQDALFVNEESINKSIPDHFIFFKPKDIVSGDFYWTTSVRSPGDKGRELFYLAVCDSTGHGVPGAFMSLLNIGFLGEAINEKGLRAPNDIFNYVRERLIKSISSEGQKDGFDGILLCLDVATKKVTYAAANNVPVIIKGGEISILPGDRMPVGKGERAQGFNLYEANIDAGDMLYLYTDGFPDQFGGPKGKKFMYKKLNEVILTICKKPISDQKAALSTTFEQWRGRLEQVDDVCVMGFRL